jgi:hypothetical protein
MVESQIKKGVFMWVFFRFAVYSISLYMSGYGDKLLAFIRGYFGFGELGTGLIAGVIVGAPWLIFENFIDNINTSIRENEAILARQVELERQEREDQERERQHQQRLDEKRRELEIEYEHIKKITMLQSNLDQGKLDKLQTMQTALKSAKNADLDTLRRQIETMKRG